MISKNDAKSPKKAHQPLDPKIRPHLDPEYVTLHDSILQFVEPLESKPWDPASRSKPSPLSIGQQKQVDVGAVFDKDLGLFGVRVFVPEGEVSGRGWPCLVWMHGGGWVNGGLASENGFLSHVCKHVRCVVVSINYRHAPEHVYPTAIDDCLSGFRWVVSPENATQLQIDTERIALGGLSAGGALAASLSMKIALDAFLPRPMFQMLICPVIDSTATVETKWASSRYSPWLTPSRMAFYQSLYFPRATDRSHWDASPCFAPVEILKSSPTTWIAVAQCDLLAPEGSQYAEQLRQADVHAFLVQYNGATHSALGLAGIHNISKKLVHDACAALADALGTTYSATDAPILSRAS